MTLGKKVVCQVPNTRQRITLDKGQVCRVSNNNTRQRAVAVNGRQPPLILCRVSSPDTRQRGSFAECHFLTLGKPYFFHFWPPNIFYSPHTIPGTPCSNAAHFSDFFLYFFNLFHLIEFSWIIQIITTSHSNNEKMNGKWYSCYLV